MILHGDCLEKLKELPANSIDAVVTDPPYGISFMGKRWDYDVPSVEVWRECLRVLKPGGHALIACGTRTQHRMVCNIEDAGFEVRDVVTWLYGSGFPKSMDVSKAIDKHFGAEREVIGINPSSRPNSKIKGHKGFDEALGDGESAGVQTMTAPSTSEAKQWQGWGTALKPAVEFFTLVRKPLEGTVAQNVLKHGVGGLNIDGCRIGENPGYSYKNGPGGNSFSVGKGVDGTRTTPVESTQGRWPANLILDEEAAALLDEQSGTTKSGMLKGTEPSSSTSNTYGEFAKRSLTTHGDSGGASRFFYVAKASKRERNAGLEGATNHHPTVKPIKLMEYLITLVTPPSGTVLDPFMGSGSTGVAAKKLGHKFIGIELNEEYLEIAEKRIEAAV